MIGRDECNKFHNALLLLHSTNYRKYNWQKINNIKLKLNSFSFVLFLCEIRKIAFECFVPRKYTIIIKDHHNKYE